MLERLSKLLTDTDYKYLVTELNDYTLDEESIYNWVYSLTTDKLHSRYIAVSIVNQVKNDNKYVIEETIKVKPSLYFYKFWDELKIETEPKSKCMIEHLIIKIYQNGCPLKDLRATTDYIRDNYSPADTKSYLALLKTSKLIKRYGINLDQWEIEAETYYEDGVKLLESLESVYD